MRRVEKNLPDTKQGWNNKHRKEGGKEGRLLGRALGLCLVARYFLTTPSSTLRKEEERKAGGDILPFQQP